MERKKPAARVVVLREAPASMMLCIDSHIKRTRSSEAYEELIKDFKRRACRAEEIREKMEREAEDSSEVDKALVALTLYEVLITDLHELLEDFETCELAREVLLKIN